MEAGVGTSLPENVVAGGASMCAEREREMKRVKREEVKLGIWVCWVFKTLRTLATALAVANKWNLATA